MDYYTNGSIVRDRYDGMTWEVIGFTESGRHQVREFGGSYTRFFFASELIEVR